MLQIQQYLLCALLAPWTIFFFIAWADFDDVFFFLWSDHFTPFLFPLQFAAFRLCMKKKISFGRCFAQERVIESEREINEFIQFVVIIGRRLNCMVQTEMNNWTINQKKKKCREFFLSVLWCCCYDRLGNEMKNQNQHHPSIDGERGKKMLTYDMHDAKYARSFDWK